MGGTLDYSNAYHFQALALVARWAQVANIARCVQQFNTSQYGQVLPADMALVEDYLKMTVPNSMISIMGH